jgi:hypothetical protein
MVMLNKGPNPMLGHRGSAMVVSMLALALLTMVGMALVAGSKTETQIAANDMWAAQALYCAEAGASEALARMADPSDAENYIGQAVGEWTTDPGWGRYVVLGKDRSLEDPALVLTAKDRLDNDGDGQVDEGGERYPEILTKQTDNPITYSWVRLQYRLDATNQVVLFGDHDDNIATPPTYNTTTGLPVLIVTAHGVEGPAQRTIQVEAVKPPFEMVKTALYTTGDNFKFNGTSFMVSGLDWDPETGDPVAGNPEMSGISTGGDPQEIRDELAPNQENNVEGTGPEPSIVPATVDVDVEALAAQFRSRAKLRRPGGTYDDVTWGDYDHYTVVHVQGDLHGTGSGIGGGVLVVDGDFVCSGEWIWYGLVIVMGDISFSGGGSGTHIFGTLVTAGSGLEVVGGNADIMYSSAALSRLNADMPYNVVSWRELSQGGLSLLTK